MDSPTRSHLPIFGAVMAAVLLSVVAWPFAWMVAGPLVPLVAAVAAVLVGFGLWLLAWRTPTPVWMLVSATVATHAVGVVAQSAQVFTQEPESSAAVSRGLILGVVMSAIVVLAAVLGASRGSRRRDRERLSVVGSVN